MFEKTEKDVQDALKDYNKAIAIEDDLEGQVQRREEIENVDPSQLTASDKSLLKIKLSKLEKELRNARKKRQSRKKEYFERCKTRDDEALATNNEVVEKKENQIYFDGHTYTTRWSCLPA